MLPSLRCVVLLSVMHTASLLPALNPYWKYIPIEKSEEELAAAEEDIIPRPNTMAWLLAVDFPRMLERARAYGVNGDVDSLRKELKEIDVLIENNRKAITMIARKRVRNPQNTNRVFIKNMANYLLTRRYLIEPFDEGYTLEVLSNYNLNPAYPAFRKRQRENVE